NRLFPWIRVVFRQGWQLGCCSVSRHDELGRPDAARAQADRFDSATCGGGSLNERRSRGRFVRVDPAGKEPQFVPEAPCSGSAHSARTLWRGASPPLRWLDRAQSRLGLSLGKPARRGASARSGIVPRRQSAPRRALVARKISRLLPVRRQSPTADTVDL